MNPFCRYALHQIEVAILSVVAIIDKLEEEDLHIRSMEGKRSVGELLTHMAVICRADFRISEGATEEEMSAFYSGIALDNLKDIQAELLTGYSYLFQEFHAMSEEELQREVTAYWGAKYTRYEWLLEIMAHLYHHRGQLHTMLIHGGGKDPNVPLFE